MKKIISIFLTVVLMLAVSVSAFADDTSVVDGSVVYKGGAEKYVYTPASTDYTATDMFNDGFKNVMPGDVIYGKIGIGNLKSGKYNVRIYMKAVTGSETEAGQTGEIVPADESGLLSQLRLIVKNGEKVIFDGAPSEGGQLSDWVLLGTFAKGKGTTLDVELQVPIELDNEYANAIGEVRWVFMAEEIPTDNPKTGDESGLGLYMLLLGLSAAAMGAVLTLNRKYN